MSSQAPQPPSIYQRDSDDPTLMTETQRPQGGALPLHSPSLLTQSYGGQRLPPFDRLTPLEIPKPPVPLPHPSAQSSYPQYSDHALPILRSARTPSHEVLHPSGLPSSAERWSAVPIDRILASQPLQSPRSDSTYSPRRISTPSPLSESSTRFPQRWVPDRGSIDEQKDYGPPILSTPYLEDRRPDVTYAPPSSNYYQSIPRPQPSLANQDPPLHSSSSKFELRVRQQPLAARACGFGERDRRVVDPPPIVQLHLKDPAGDPAELRYPFHVVHCTLWNEDGSSDETALPQSDRRTTRRLMGTLVSSPLVGVDENEEEGCFFCFPDLSCRTNGRFRLRFVLMRLEASELHPGGFSPIVARTMSDVFTVYTAKDFPGMRASTALTKALKAQGCTISVKKGNEKSTPHGRDDDSGEDDMGDTLSTGSKSKKRRRD